MSRRAAALLSPLLIPQAAWVIARAHRLPEATGLRTGQIGSGPSLRLLMIGDSSAAGVGAPRQDEALAGQLTSLLAQQYTVDWRLIAKTGATTASTLSHLKGREQIKADVAILIHGVNETTRLVPPARFATQQTSLISLLQNEWKTPRILISAVPPVGHFPLLPRPLRTLLGHHAAKLNAVLQTVVEANSGCVLVPFDMPIDTRLMADDGFHPGPQAYTRWAALLARHIEIS